MKKAGQWKNQMVLALELPPDLAYNETIVTLTGQTEAVIENYKSVFKYKFLWNFMLSGFFRLSVR